MYNFYIIKISVIFFLSACGQHVNHGFRFSPNTSNIEKQWITEAADTANKAFGCQAIKITNDSDYFIIVSDNSTQLQQLGENHLGLFNYTTGYIYLTDTAKGIQVIIDGMNYTEQATIRLALHEFGHALGMREHSSNSDDIMYSELVLSTTTDKQLSDYVSQVRKNGHPCD